MDQRGKREGGWVLDSLCINGEGWRGKGGHASWSEVTKREGVWRESLVVID